MTSLSFDVFARDVGASLTFDKLGLQLKRTSKDFDDFGNRTAKSLAGFANSLSNIPTAAAGIQGVATTLAGLSGAVGLVPAAGAGALLAIESLRVGVDGFGQALKDSGDPAKFGEDLKSLAPSARETATAVAGLRDDWKSLQGAVQQKLFENLGGAVKSLGAQYLPVLRVGMSGIAAEFNTSAHSVAAFLAQSQSVTSVTTIFGNTRSAVGHLGEALAPLVSILLDIVAVGSDFLPGLTGGFGKAAQSAADFVHHARETGELKQWIQKGLDTFKELGRLIGNVASIVVSVFTGLNAGGKNLLGTLVSITGKIADFLKSFEGQSALKALGEALNAVSSVVTQVMITAFQQLAPIIVQLAPAFAAVAQQVGGVLVSALQILGPILAAIAGFISANIDWLGPLAIALFAAAKAVTTVTEVWRVLKLAFTENPWALIIAAVVALAVLIVTHWDNIKAALAAAWDWIKNTAGAAWEGIKNVIVDPVVTAAKWIGDRVEGIVQFFKDLPGRIGQALSNLGDHFKSAIIDPIEKIDKWVGEKVANIIQWFKDLPGKIGQALEGLGDAIGTAFKGALNWLIGLLNGLITGVNWIIVGINDISPFDDIPQIRHIDKLHTGGVVPGRPGQESIWKLEAGERVLPADWGLSPHLRDAMTEAKTASASSGEGTGRTVSVTLVANGPIGSSQELENWLVKSLEGLRRRGRLD